MKDVLCIFSYRRVFILDMDKILSGEDYKDGTSPPRPPLERVLDFEKSKLPLAMGLLKFGNFLYMFGGEYHSKDSYDSIYTIGCSEDSDNDLFEYFHHTVVFGAGIPEDDPPCPVYRLDLTNNESEPVQLRPMLGPKLFAIVEEIGGQIYVLSEKPLSSSRPMFEVWNPITEEWRALPNPPNSYFGWEIVSSCVCGSNIICQMRDSLFNRFRTVSETWERIVDLSDRELIPMIGSFDVLWEDVCIKPRRREGYLCAVMDGPEGKDGYSVEVESSKTKPQIPDFPFECDTMLVDTREQGEYMCGLETYIGDESFALYVFVFKVEKLESEKVPPSQAALSVRYLKRKVYDFTHIKCKNEEYPLHIFSKAVIGRLLHNTSTGSGECSRGEAKRKRKEVDDDDDDDEGQVVSTHGLVMV